MSLHHVPLDIFITEAEFRNLTLVKDGKVLRIYRPNGNVIRGGHSFTIRSLEGRGLIEESNIGAGHGYVLRLTKKGKGAFPEFDL